ncbi:MAG: PD-(D/E)XK nuclease family protein [Planctomycetia bacterium]|nr:PD-(D/E)XK nuclease family protein [Planctomycetia bacterium]
MQQIFFDWTKPFLTEVVEHLLNQWVKEDQFVLDNLLLILPNSRAIKRIRHLLESRIKELSFQGRISSNGSLPQYLTLRDLPEELYYENRPQASSIARLTIWQKALKETIRSESSEIKALIPFPPSFEDWKAQMEIADMLNRLHQDLSAECLNFKDVANYCRRLGITDEMTRWNVLDRLYQKYYQKLNELNLVDEQIARIQAIKEHKCRTDRIVYLIGTVDLNAVQKKMLEQVSQSVWIMTYASINIKNKFDSFGCIIPEAWQNEPIIVSDDQLFQTDTFVEQAAVAAKLFQKNLFKLNEAKKTQTVLKNNDPRQTKFIDECRVETNEPLPRHFSTTICVPNEQLVPFLEQQMLKIRQDIILSTGESFRKSRVYRLFLILAAFLKNRKFKFLTELLRNPDIEDYIERHWNDGFDYKLPFGDWLGELDRYQTTFMPDHVDGFWKPFVNEDVPTQNTTFPYLRRAYAVLDQLLSFFKKPSRKENNENQNELPQPLTPENEPESDLSDVKLELERVGNINDPKNNFFDKNQKFNVETMSEVIENTKKYQGIFSELFLSLPEWGTVFQNFLNELYNNSNESLETSEPANSITLNSRSLIEDGIPFNLIEDKTQTINSLEIRQEFATRDNDKIVTLKRKQIESSLSVIKSYLLDFLALPVNENEIVSSSEAIELLLRLTVKERQQPNDSENALEIIGWLDLMTDDSATVAITCFNDNVVPSTFSNEIFLSGFLRRALHLENDRSRYCRDAYYLSAILATHSNIPIIFSRRSLEGDPLLPSRLLFADKSEVIAKRVCRFFDTESSFSDNQRKILSDLCENFEEIDFSGNNINKSETSKHSPQKCSIEHSFEPPILKMKRPIPSIMKVTEFRDFIACPYRYFLKHQFMLKSAVDNRSELDAAGFGNIIHEILKRFGKNEQIRDCDDPFLIQDWLNRQLDQYIKDFFGWNSSPVLPVQTELIRKRLNSFASWQAQWRSEGNLIRYVETSTASEMITFNVDNIPVQIKGRIDRIDYNQRINRWFIFDYKTFDSIEEGKKIPDADFADSPLISLGVGNSVDKRHRKKKSVAINLNPAKSMLSKFLDVSPSKETNSFDDNLEESQNQPSFWEWTDLQLPLYRFFFKDILHEYRLDANEIEPTPGYIVLPQTGLSKAVIAPWTKNDFLSANETAFWIIRTIRRLWKTDIRPDALIDPLHPEKGTILSVKSPPFMEELAPITLENQLLNL